MNVDLIRLPTTDGFELNASYKKFNDDCKTAIVFIHGMTGSFLGNTSSNVYQVCEDLKISFLGLNTRGANIIDSLKKYDENGKKTRFLCGTSFENFEDSLIDLQSAIDFLKNKGYKKIILVGHSTGCQKTAYFQKIKQLKEMVGVIFLAPIEDVVAQKMILGKELFEESINYSKEKVDQNLGDELMPKIFQTAYFSCKRYYDLYSGNSNEAKILSYQNELKELENLNCKLGIVLAKEDEYASISAEEMKKYYDNLNVETIVKIVPGNHSFAETKKELIENLKEIIKEIV